MARKSIVTKVSGRKEKKGKIEVVPKKSVGTLIKDVFNRLSIAIRKLDDAVGHLDEGSLDDAQNAVMKAMDIIGSDDLHRELDRSAEEIQHTISAIEDLESGLL